jgi:LuxR family maltose regulon positive regulatory protein
MSGLPAHAGGGLIPRRDLFELLGAAGRVTMVSAPAGSGKTSLLRSWIADGDLEANTAWVCVGGEERDPQAFWLAVLESLRSTGAGSRVVREMTPAPDLDGWMILQQLLEDLGSLQDSVLLVIDDLHELGDTETLHQLELLLRTAPLELRFALLTRSDVRLGLHRLRLEESVTEIRQLDLRFTVEEARALLDAAEVELPEASVESLVANTEGWAAGLRLAALSLSRQPDPERFALAFSGRERTVAEYLLAEILEHQPDEVSRLLLLTSVLERVSGPLADHLLGTSGSERILSELEQAGAFVVALNGERSWFRYHRLFADLLVLELRRTAPEQLPGVHLAAAEWFAEHGYPVEAIRHAQAAQNWSLAAELLADNWFRLELDGRRPTAHELLAGFPAARIAADAELSVLAAADARGAGSVEDVERHLAVATRAASSVPEARRGRFQIALGMVRLLQARARNDVEAVIEEARRLLTPGETHDATELGVSEDLRAVALMDVGIAEIWAGRLDEGERHLDQALVEARRIGRPLLELQAQSHWAVAGLFRSPGLADKRARPAIELARKHGWEDRAPAAGAYLSLARLNLWRGQLDDVEPWLEHAERALHADGEPAPALMLYESRGVLEFTHGRHEEAMTAIRAAERMEELLGSANWLVRGSRSHRIRMLIGLGETERAERALAALDCDELDRSETRIAVAGLRLAQDDPGAAAAVLGPIVDGSAPVPNAGWEIHAQLQQAIASDALRDPGATSRALERALELAEADRLLLPFLLAPIAELLEDHLELHTAHSGLISEIVAVLAGRTPAVRPGDVEPLADPLSESELRLLRYLPTSLQGPEIAAELFVSVNTIRTHMRHVYAKLGVHRRVDAVERARELGLLPPSSMRRS